MNGMGIRRIGRIEGDSCEKSIAASSKDLFFEKIWRSLYNHTKGRRREEMRDGVLIVQNISREGPGLFETTLKERRIPSTVIDLEKDGISFPSPENFRAVVVLGGPDSANDKTEKITRELAWIQDILEVGVPYLGICLGLQMLVKAAGGSVVRTPVKEVGFFDPEGRPFSLELTLEGKRDPLFQGIPQTPHVFQLHGETVELKEDMSLLATGRFCINQAVRVGKNAYGLQCHFELTFEMLQVWLDEDPDLKPLDNSEVLQYFRSIQQEYTAIGQRIANNFLDIAGF